MLHRAKESLLTLKERSMNRLQELFRKRTTESKDRKALLTLAPIFVLAVFFVSVVYTQWTKPAQLYLDDQPMLYVNQEEEAMQVLEEVKAELAQNYPQDANLHYENKIHFSKKGVETKAEAVSEEELRNFFKENLAWKIQASIIEVDQVKTAVLSSTEEAEAVLEAVKQTYLPKDGSVNVLEAEFVEPVKITQDIVALDEIVSKEAAVAALTQGKEKIQEYVLQPGDSLWTVARKNNTTVAELEAANPDLGKVLQIGQVIKLAKAEPLVSVKMVVEKVQEEDIPFETVYQKDSSSYVGQQTVVTKGEKGKKEVKYQIAQVNGVELERKVISETVVSEPVSKVVKTGTKTIVASRGSGGGSGALSWPIRGRINSAYGKRGRGTHTGIDIDANKGDPIYSAKAGTVTKASWSGGYGNCVIIDHGNGLSTLYGHLSKINVKVGQKVGANELIGLAGSTGNSTGPHLHFEVRVNGKHTNPMNYLK